MLEDSSQSLVAAGLRVPPPDSTAHLIALVALVVGGKGQGAW
jgi:hypothetical protein